MGLFSKKTDAEIIAEARALYIKGDLSGANLKLIKLAQKGNPDACYLSAKIQLEQAEKKNRELYMKSAKINLEKAVAAGHKEAAELMSKRFDVPQAKNQEQNSSALDEATKKEAHVDVKPEIKADVLAEKAADINACVNHTVDSKAVLEKDAILEIIKNIKESLGLEPVNSSSIGEVEKFIQNHNLGVSSSDVVAYKGTAVFSSGKKGHIMTDRFLYYSDNGKRGSKVELEGIVSVESSMKCEFYVTYANGERKTFSNTEYISFAEYYVKIINAIIALANNIIGVESVEVEETAKAEAEAESVCVPEKMSINEETVSRDVCVHKEDSVVGDVSETERWYETIPVISVDQLSDYDINFLFRLATEYSTMGAKEARQMIYSASEIVGIGFDEERSFELIDKDGNTFEIKNTDLDLASMISLVEAIFVDYFEINEDLDRYYEKILYHDFGLTDNLIKRLLEAMEEILGVEPGKLKCLPFFEELNLSDFIVLVALLILPVEKGFAEVLNHIEQLESCQKNEEPNSVKEEKK